MTVDEAADIARYLVANNRGAETVWASYVGQERRAKSASSRFGRGWEHGTARGNDIIAEQSFDTSRRDGGKRCMPWGAVAIRRHTLAFLPLDAAGVNTAEAALLSLVGGLGAIVLNNSAGGEVAERWLADDWKGGVARCVTVGNAYIKQRGLQYTRTVRVEDGLRHALMARCLRPIHRLLRGGRGRKPDGTAFGPDLLPAAARRAGAAAPPGVAAGAAAAALVAAGVAAAALAGAGVAGASGAHGDGGGHYSWLACFRVLTEPEREAVHSVHLWADACTCRYARGRLCSHILWLRWYEAVRFPDRDRSHVLARDPELLQYLPVAFGHMVPFANDGRDGMQMQAAAQAAAADAGLAAAPAAAGAVDFWAPGETADLDPGAAGEQSVMAMLAEVEARISQIKLTLTASAEVAAARPVATAAKTLLRAAEKALIASRRALHDADESHRRAGAGRRDQTAKTAHEVAAREARLTSMT